MGTVNRADVVAPNRCGICDAISRANCWNARIAARHMRWHIRRAFPKRGSSTSHR